MLESKAEDCEVCYSHMSNFPTPKNEKPQAKARGFRGAIAVRVQGGAEGAYAQYATEVPTR